jgi:hypothetical protein
MGIIGTHLDGRSVETMKRKTAILLTVSVLLLLGSALTLWALDQYYNRPSPVMDFVPQDQGTYDTIYPNYTDADCRTCHGDLTGDLHRYSGLGLNGVCDLPECHAVGPPAPGTQISCTSPDCHVIGSANAKVHHSSDLAASGQCTACHRPDLVGGLRAEGLIMCYPKEPGPAPYRCENCHWEDTFKLSPDVSSLFDLHHMQFEGPVSAACYECHSMSASDPLWNPDNPVLVRFCENCHTPAILHSIHQDASYGWEAVGFHVPNINNTNPTDVEADTYREFTAEEKCVACHGETPSGEQVVAIAGPAILSLSPYSGTGDTAIWITGTNFGEPPAPGASVIFTPRAGDTSNPVIIPSGSTSWSPSIILVDAPLTAPGGNYDITVETSTGMSNRALFTLTGTATAPPVPGTPVITAISPTVGTDEVTITIHGSNFGDRHCCDREVQFQADGQTGVFTMPVYSWTDTEVVLRFLPWTVSDGLQHVRVHNEGGDSNIVDFVNRAAPGATMLARDDLALTITGGGYGALQSEVFGDHYGYASQVKIGDRDHTYTATNITSWADTQIDLVLDAFVDENGTPVGEQFGNFGLLVETEYFYDTNTNGQLDSGDQVYHRVTSTLALLELPKVECELIPDTTDPIPRGGTLGFQVNVTNNTSGMGMVLFGTKVTKPNLTQTGFIWGPLQVWLNPYQTKSGHKNHTIPTGFELGTYTYHGYVGRYGQIYQECQFDFEVVAP